MAQIVFAAYQEDQFFGTAFKDEITMQGHVVLPARSPQQLAELIERRQPDGVVIFSIGRSWGKEHFLDHLPGDLPVPVLYLYTIWAPKARPNLTALQVPEERNVFEKLVNFANSLQRRKS